MRKYLCALSCLCAFTLAAAAGDWETDFAKAKEKAQKEGRFILADFTGSDWCGWCIKLDKEVFSKPEFQKYAKDSLVLLKLDFPKRKPLPKKEAAANGKLAQSYKVRGFPTVVLMLPDGTEVARTGYLEGGPEVYVKSLQDTLAPHQDKLPKPAAGKGAAHGSQEPAEKVAKTAAADKAN